MSGCTLVRRAAFRVILPALAITGLIAWAQKSDPPLPDGTRADLVIVSKADRMLNLYRGAELLRSYEVSLGGDPIGPKRREGDGRTPEGRYVLDYRKADSSYHRALHVSYPSSEDRAAAKAEGVDPGGLVMVHGLRNGLGLIGRLHTVADWTDGCVAVTNREIEEIWRVVPDGTPIEIKP